MASIPAARDDAPDDPCLWTFKEDEQAQFRQLLVLMNKWRRVLRVNTPILDACVEGCKCGGNTPPKYAVLAARDLSVHGYAVPAGAPLYLCTQGFVLVGDDGTTSPPVVGGVVVVDESWQRKTRRAKQSRERRGAPRAPRKRVPPSTSATRVTPPRAAKRRKSPAAENKRDPTTAAC